MPRTRNPGCGNDENRAGASAAGRLVRPDWTEPGQGGRRGREPGRDRRGPALHATWGLRVYSERDEKL